MYCIDGISEVVISLTTICWMGIEVLKKTNNIWYMLLWAPYIYKFLAGMIVSINFCQQSGDMKVAPGANFDDL